MTKSRAPQAAGSRQSVAICGAGNLGRVLAQALTRAGWRVSEVIHQKNSRSAAKAGALAAQVHARAYPLGSQPLEADILLLTVPDDALPDVAHRLAQQAGWKGKAVLHTSGALPASVLAELKARGASIGSFHPMNTFVARSKPSIKGVPVAIEGGKRAQAAAFAMCEALGAQPFAIAAADKPLYHAMGAFSSPLLVALLEVAERAGRQAGLRHPRSVITHILKATIENYLARGPQESFSGPIRRGDLRTIASHLASLKKVGNAREVYRVLALNAAENLPVKNKKQILALLKK